MAFSLKKEYANISVTAFIAWQGRALIVQRADNEDFLPSYWEQVGGKVEPGETLEQALVREVKEEAGLDVNLNQQYNQFEYTHTSGRLMCEYAYTCQLIGQPTITLSPEHQVYKWITQKELKTIQPVTDVMREVIQKGFSILEESRLR